MGMGIHPVALVNCTPHDICLIDVETADGLMDVTIAACGMVARVEVIRVPRRLEVQLFGAPAYVTVNENGYGALVGLPDETPGVWYIVSSIAARAAREAGRYDVLIVDDTVDDTVRDADGRIIGARALAVLR